MTTDNRDADGTCKLQPLLTTLASPLNAADFEAARAALVAYAAERMRSLAGRMLAGSPKICRWTETDDIVQGALLRLYRALGGVTPNDPQHFLRLASLQVRRELIDLTRRFGNPDSFATNHDTNVSPAGGQRTDEAADAGEQPDRLAEWTRFHATVDALRESDRELFGMVWYLGLSQDEIAALFDCSTRTVRRRWDETKRAFTAAFRGGPPE